MISDRVRHARAYHGWSQQQLADLAGTTQPKISQLEKGVYTSADLVGAIADVTLYDRSWFDRGPLPDLPMGSLRFRKQAASRRSDDERIRAHVRQALEIVERVATDDRVPRPRLKAVGREDISGAEDIERLALDTRESLGVGAEDPIPNVVRATERSGVVVIGSVVDIQKHGGASYWPDYPAGRPVICISRGVAGDRQRMTVAHELGHLLLHQLRNLAPAAAEPEAFRFAGALLIPHDQAVESLAHPVTLRLLAQVKARWGISIRALIRRALDLRLIDTAHRESLEKQLSRRGWLRHEPVDVPYEEPVLMRRLIEMATGSSGAGAATQLGLPPLAVRDLVA